MDVNQTYIEQENYEQSYFGLPADDYDKNGNLRPVRKRILKKLLKYEFKAYLPITIIAGSVLLGLSLLLFMLGFFTRDNSDGTRYWTFAFLPYMYGCLFMILIPFILGFVRYGKTFFKSQGYLTMSLPASAEEHLLAKRIAASVNAFICITVAVLSLILAVAPMLSGVGDMIVPEESNIFLDILALVESITIFLLGTVLIFSLGGFLGCWGHRGVKKVVIVFTVIGVYLTMFIGNIILVTLIESGILYEITPVMEHVFTWLQILLYAALIFLCTRFEIHTLKNKLNLK